MSDEEAEKVFVRLRLGQQQRRRVLPALRHLPHGLHGSPHPNGAPAGAAKPAARISSASRPARLFAFHKMPLRSYLMAIAIFANEVKGKSMLALESRPRHAIQDGLRPGAQDARSDGR